MPFDLMILLRRRAFIFFLMSFFLWDAVEVVDEVEPTEKVAEHMEESSFDWRAVGD